MKRRRRRKNREEDEQKAYVKKKGEIYPHLMGNFRTAPMILNEWKRIEMGANGQTAAKVE
jgi:deoxyadenosine/deoxycytidine kinase